MIFAVQLNLNFLSLNYVSYTMQVFCKGLDGKTITFEHDELDGVSMKDILMWVNAKFNSYNKGKFVSLIINGTSYRMYSDGNCSIISPFSTETIVDLNDYSLVNVHRESGWAATFHVTVNYKTL